MSDMTYHKEDYKSVKSYQSGVSNFIMKIHYPYKTACGLDTEFPQSRALQGRGCGEENLGTWR